MQGAQLPLPIGGKQREIVVDLDTAKLYAVDVLDRDRRVVDEDADRRGAIDGVVREAMLAAGLTRRRARARRIRATDQPRRDQWHEGRTLAAWGLSPSDISNAVNAQNLVVPRGTVKIGGSAGIYDGDGAIDKGAACTQVAHDAVAQSQVTVAGAVQAGASVAIACGAGAGGGASGGGGGYGSTGGGCKPTGDAGSGPDTGMPGDTAR